MKANELMVGDLVTFRDSLQDPKVLPIKIIELHEYDDAFLAKIGRCECDICDELEFDDDIVGIPLTSEILEKNGFVNDSYYNECVADGKFVQVQIWAYREDNILIDWDGYTLRAINDFGHPCEEITLQGSICVHELQHALRLCGIDKEIIL